MKLFILLFITIGTTYGFPFPNYNSTSDESSDPKMGQHMEMLKELPEQDARPDEVYYYHSIKQSYGEDSVHTWESQYNPKTNKIEITHTIQHRRIPNTKPVQVYDV